MSPAPSPVSLLASLSAFSPASPAGSASALHPLPLPASVSTLSPASLPASFSPSLPGPLLSPPDLPVLLAWLFVGGAGLLLLLLLPLALNRLALLHRGLRAPSTRPGAGWSGPLPPVTVQLPLYNEAEVVDGLLEAVARLDWPRDRLEIQILDDSTDETSARIEAALPGLRARGLRVDHLQREARKGFKAGALAEGLVRAEGAYLLLLDADFLPPPSLLHDLLPSFREAEGEARSGRRGGGRRGPEGSQGPGGRGVGMVQARWDHLNESHSALTRAQALLLDGHFFFEQGGRHAAGHFMNFNGTAGVWDRRAIEEAGGWSADTLTEDLDLSYRAQMAGWRFVYRGDVGVPAELPQGIRAFEIQQERWARGGIETGRKLLPRLWRGAWPASVRREGSFHLLGHLAHPVTLALGVLLLPSALGRHVLGLGGWILLDLGIFLLATGAFLLFYLAAARTRRRPWRASLPGGVRALVLGVGLTAPVSRAVVRGLLAPSPGARKGGAKARASGGSSGEPFHRTPKGGEAGLRRYADGTPSTALPLKVGLFLWMLGCTVAAVAWGFYPTLPFLLLFGSGWGWLALGEWRERGRLTPGRVASAGPGAKPAPCNGVQRPSPTPTTAPQSQSV